MFDFKDYKFEVMDITVQGTPDLFVNLNGLTFSKKIIEDMAYPLFVRPLVDAEHKAFAIQACKQTDDRAIKFSKPRSEQINGVSNQSKALLRIIRTLMRETWDKGCRYRITGSFFPDARAMVFDLSSAEELSPVRQMSK